MRSSSPSGTCLVKASSNNCKRQAGNVFSVKTVPAVEFGHPEARGRIGIIAPYAKDFCADCNRLRLGSDGEFHLCLFGDGGFDLRDLLKSDSQQDELVARIVALTRGKAPGHRLHQGNSGATPHLASIGG